MRRLAVLAILLTLSGCGDDPPPPEPAREARVVKPRKKRKKKKADNHANQGDDQRVRELLAQAKRDRRRNRAKAEKRKADRARREAGEDVPHDDDDPAAPDDADEMPTIGVRRGELNLFRVQDVEVGREGGHWLIKKARIYNDNNILWTRAVLKVLFLDRGRNPLGGARITVQNMKPFVWKTVSSSRGPTLDAPLHTVLFEFDDQLSTRENREIDEPVDIVYDRGTGGLKYQGKVTRDNFRWFLRGKVSDHAFNWRVYRIGVEWLNGRRQLIHRQVINLDGLVKSRPRTVNLEGPEGSERVAGVRFCIDESIAR
jgi:hypothetical protein